MVTKEISKKENNQAVVTRRQEQSTYMPAADIFETKDSIIMKLDMPGVSKDDVEINLDKDMLAVTGKVKQEYEGSILYQEYRIGDYHREFALSEDLDKDAIKAQMQAGVLTLTIPKAEKAKPKRIQISSGE